MKEQQKNIIKLVMFLAFAGYCAYSWHDWYWYWYSGIKDPLVTVHFEESFKGLSNQELLTICKERASPRTEAAYRVLSDRGNTDDIFDELFERCDYDLITSDKQRKVYDVLTARYINGSFDYKHQMAMTILAKFGYTDMITEAGKFIVREQYSDALEALKYFPDKPQATELITAIARQSKDPVAAFEAERLLKKL